MKMRHLMLAVIAGLALVSSAATTYADLTYAYTFDQSLYSVAPDGTVNVSVFLQESGQPGDPFVLDPITGVGLTGTGVTISYPAGGVASVASVADITGNNAFDNGGFGIATSLSPGSAGFTQSTLFNPNVTGTLIAPDTYDVLIGTFEFTAGPSSGIETLTASRFDPSLSEVIDGNGNVLDGLIANGTAQLQVTGAATAVPLPSAFHFFLFMTICLAGWRWMGTKHFQLR